MYDDNLSRGQLKSDIKDDTALVVAAGGGQFLHWGSGTQAVLKLNVRKETYFQYEGLSNLGLGLNASVRTKFGLGADAPWLRLSAATTRLEYHNDIRSGWLNVGGLAVGKRVSDRLDLRAQYQFERKTVDDAVAVVPGISGEVFDLTSRTVSLGAEFALTERTALSCSYDRRTGDIASSTKINLATFRVSDAVNRDPVFGPGVFGYRLHAVTHSIGLGGSYALGPNQALDLRWRRHLSYGTNDVDYYGSSVQATYLRTF